MSEHKLNYRLIIILGALLIVVVGIALLARCGRPDAPLVTPVPPTVTATRPPKAPNPVTATPKPTSTDVPTPEPPATPTAQFTATSVPTSERPTATPIAARGVHRVERGETLWGIACAWYGDMPLLPGANPLTPCACWPGVYAAGPQIRPPQLIYPGEEYVIPEACGQ